MGISGVLHRIDVDEAGFDEMKQDPMVGGAAMYPTKNIVENAMNSADHTTLVAAVKAAGLVDTLEGAWPVHGVRADE